MNGYCLGNGMQNHVRLTVACAITDMATLEQYDFRQQRRQPPDLKTSKEENLTTDASASTQLGYSTLEDDIRELKTFDLDYTYGPTIGVTRLQRWERAKSFGLNPPDGVKELIEKHPDDSRYTECLWNDTILGDRSATAD